MTHWTPDDIDWSQFDRAKLSDDILKVVKAASMVERNAGDYTEYLGKVFADDPAFRDLARQWQSEEVQHGDVLGRYAELADPEFSFKDRFKRFTDGYKVPIEVEGSVRGSLTGELLARCIVETGTSSFYSALRDATDEPVLKAICHRIAGDEFRHYKMFYQFQKRYIESEGVGVMRRALVAIGRIKESDDDELAFAYHAANEAADTPYSRERSNREYAARAYSFYRPQHTERAVSMILKAVGIDPTGWIGSAAKSFAWKKMRSRAEALRIAA